MTSLDAIRKLASKDHLEPLGALHLSEEDYELAGTGTLVLLGPKEPGFWPMLTSAPEFLDRQPDPIDRWSHRVIREMASTLSGKAYFPFQSNPYLPFYRWALETNALWASPVRLLVHGSQGLMVSIRGALVVPEELELPNAAQSPCETCVDRPCVTACPVGALIEGFYEVDACHDHLDSPRGADCLSGGCKVRLSCPAGSSYGRLAAQSAYHMAQFHP